MTDDPRFLSWAIVSTLLIGLWLVESGRAGLLKTVWTTPDSRYQVGANYQAGQSGGNVGGGGTGGIGGLLGIGGTLGDIFGAGTVIGF